MSAPRSKRDEASVFKPSRLLVRRTDCRREVSAFERHARGRRRDLGRAAAHDAGDRLRASGVGDHEHVGVELPLHTVQRPNHLALFRAARAKLCAGKRGEIERVHRLAELDVHVVSDVDNRADRTDACGLEPAREPRRRRSDRDVGHRRGVTRTQVGVFDRDAQAVRVADRRRGERERSTRRGRGRTQRHVVGGRNLARESDHAEAVGPVRGHFEVDHRIVAGERLD